MISKKKIRAINNITVIIEALESVEPQYCHDGTGFWWNSPPDTWERSEQELFDLLSESERRIKKEVFEILGVESL